VNELVIGDFFMQKGHVITYESRKLSLVEHNHLVLEKQLLAIVHALKVW